MPFIASFLNALLGTGLVCIAAKFAFESFAVSRPARFGAFSVAFGFALGRYSFSGPADGRALEAISAAGGSIIALLILWIWLMKPAPEISE